MAMDGNGSDKEKDSSRDRLDDTIDRVKELEQHRIKDSVDRETNKRMIDNITFENRIKWDEINERMKELEKRETRREIEYRVWKGNIKRVIYGFLGTWGLSFMGFLWNYWDKVWAAIGGAIAAVKGK